MPRHMQAKIGGSTRGDIAVLGRLETCLCPSSIKTL